MASTDTKKNVCTNQALKLDYNSHVLNGLTIRTLDSEVRFLDAVKNRSVWQPDYFNHLTIQNPETFKIWTFSK